MDQLSRTCMVEGKILRVCTRECGINLEISFHWRYSFLKLPAQMKARFFEGIVEIDKTFMLLRKGNKKLIRTPKKRGDSG